VGIVSRFRQPVARSQQLESPDPYGTHKPVKADANYVPALNKVQHSFITGNIIACHMRGKSAFGVTVLDTACR